MMPRFYQRGPRKGKPEARIDTNLGRHGTGEEVATTSHYQRYNDGWPASLPQHARAHATPSHVPNMKHYCRVPSSRPRNPVEVCWDDDARGVVVMGGGGGAFEG